jgi:tetratricopeptide (TPR) repeat protein
MSMEHLRKADDPDIDGWLDLAERLNEDLVNFEKKGILDKDKFYEAGRSISRSFLYKTAFINDFSQTEAARSFEDLCKMLHKLFELEQTAAVLIMMAFDLIKSGEEKYDYVIEYAAEGICLAIAEQKGLHIEYPEEEDGKDEEADADLERINELVEKTNMYDDQKKYDDALNSVNSLLTMIGGYPKDRLLIIDEASIMNNKAYYLFVLGRMDDALDAADKALAKYPKKALIHHTKAEILNCKGLYGEALDSINKSIELEPGDDKMDLKKKIMEQIR